LIALDIPRAEVPRDEIDPIVVIEEQQKKEKRRRKR